MYRGRARDDIKPHIFAVADQAFRNMMEEGSNQSILVTLVTCALERLLSQLTREQRGVWSRQN